MLRRGEQGPPFQLPDLSGKLWRLDGVPAVVVFWKPSCATCHLAFPYLERLTQAYPPDRWRLLAVSQDTPAASRAFAEELRLSLPLLIEGEGWPVSRQYDPEATPTLFFVRADGEIVLTSVGFDKAELNEASRLLAEALGVEPQKIAPEDDGNAFFKPG
jgi:peroxiredoxin